jgi:hypothetical protein
MILKITDKQPLTEWKRRIRPYLATFVRDWWEKSYLKTWEDYKENFSDVLSNGRQTLSVKIDEIDKLVAKYDVQLHYNAMGSKVANKNLLEINKVLAEIEELIVYMNLIL